METVQSIGVIVSSEQPSKDRSYRIQAPARLSEATLLFLLPGDSSPTPALTVDGEAVPATTVEHYGHRFAQITADLCGEQEISIQKSAA